MRPPLPRRLPPGTWIAIDHVCAVLIAAVYVVVWRDLAFLRGPRWIDAVVLALVVLPVAVRRRWPGQVLWLVVAAQLAASLLGSTPVPALAAAFAIYLIPQRFPRRRASLTLGGTLLATVAGAVLSAAVAHPRAGSNPVATAAISGLLITVAWMIGDSVRHQRDYAARARQRADRQASADLAEARRALTEERLRIARELHDVVAHTMSVIAVQAGVANHVIADHPREAARALASIEQTSRGALREMRALLGVLRGDDDPPPGPDRDGELAPAPGLADTDRLVERAAAAGLRVMVDVRGERPVLSAGLDLAAYRIVQEALTNVIKHAATDTCRVSVTYEPDALAVEVTDHGGAGRDVATATAGHGIIGMRERATAYGGRLRAGPVPGGGFAVDVRFPLTATAA